MKISLLPLVLQISDLLSQEIFSESPNSDSDNAVDDEFQCNIENDFPQIFNQSERSNLNRYFWCCLRGLRKF